MWWINFSKSWSWSLDENFLCIRMKEILAVLHSQWCFFTKRKTVKKILKKKNYKWGNDIIHEREMYSGQTSGTDVLLKYIEIKTMESRLRETFTWYWLMGSLISFAFFSPYERFLAKNAILIFSLLISFILGVPCGIKQDLSLLLSQTWICLCTWLVMPQIIESLILLLDFITSKFGSIPYLMY